MVYIFFDEHSAGMAALMLILIVLAVRLHALASPRKPVCVVCTTWETKTVFKDELMPTFQRFYTSLLLIPPAYPDLDRNPCHDYDEDMGKSDSRVFI